MSAVMRLTSKGCLWLASTASSISSHLHCVLSLKSSRTLAKSERSPPEILIVLMIQDKKGSRSQGQNNFKLGEKAAPKPPRPGQIRLGSLEC